MEKTTDKIIPFSTYKLISYLANGASMILFGSYQLFAKNSLILALIALIIMFSLLVFSIIIHRKNRESGDEMSELHLLKAKSVTEEITLTLMDLVLVVFLVMLLFDFKNGLPKFQADFSSFVGALSLYYGILNVTVQNPLVGQPENCFKQSTI